MFHRGGVDTTADRHEMALQENLLNDATGDDLDSLDDVDKSLETMLQRNDELLSQLLRKPAAETSTSRSSRSSPCDQDQNGQVRVFSFYFNM